MGGQVGRGRWGGQRRAQERGKKKRAAEAGVVVEGLHKKGTCEGGGGGPGKGQGWAEKGNR